MRWENFWTVMDEVKTVHSLTVQFFNQYAGHG